MLNDLQGVITITQSLTRQSRMDYSGKVKNRRYYLLNNSMERSPSWEADGFSASPETTRILWNPKVHFYIYNRVPPASILSQLDPVHNPVSHFLKTHLNVIFLYTLGSPKWSLSFRLPHQNPVYTSLLLHTCYMPRPFRSSRFYHLKNIGWAVQTIKLLIE